MASTTVADPKTWTRARRRSDGKPFWFIPSAKNPSTVYMATATACTCRCFYLKGACKHARAVAQAERPSTADAERARRERLRELLRND